MTYVTDDFEVPIALLPRLLKDTHMCKGQPGAFY